MSLPIKSDTVHSNNVDNDNDNGGSTIIITNNETPEKSINTVSSTKAHARPEKQRRKSYYYSRSLRNPTKKRLKRVPSHFFDYNYTHHRVKQRQIFSSL